ncbi:MULTISPECIES: hypothetical protein [Nocardioides]|uniref:hypothetical protein n=1 Tax=Nocardioides TaxID=1839 RepID=UPI00032EE972|nr:MULTISPECIES: hypothetical protein [Nocardioides]EON22279.1 type I secretion outer membrane protein [Nocardioides sp. CF8]
MAGALSNAKQVVEDSLVASLRATAGSVVQTAVKGTIFGAVLTLVVGTMVYLLSDSWLRVLLMAVLITIATTVASVYLGIYRAAGAAIVAANDEANLASHALEGVLDVARAGDRVTGGIGGNALDAASSRVIGAAKLLGKERSGVLGFVSAFAKKQVYKRVGSIAAVELAATSGNDVDWDATSDRLENRIDGMVTNQVMAALNRGALVVAVPIVVGALVLGLVVGLL